MTITYVNDLRLSEMATGDNSGTWGNVTNTNLELVGDALGYGTEAITTNADTHASTIADGSADAARAMYIKYTGTLDSTCTITIGPNTISRVHIIENATSGSQSIIIKQGSGATVTIGTGAVKIVYLDGAGSGAAVTDALVDLDLTGTTTIAALTQNGGAVFNESGADVDFRVESNNSEKMFVVDAGSDFVSISGANGLSEVLNGGTASINSLSANSMLEINTRSATDGHSGIINFIKAPNTSGTPTATADGDYLGRVSFIGADTGNNLRVGAQILTIQSGTDSDSVPSRLIFNTSSGSSDPVNRFEISTAETIVNEDSNNVDFRVEGNARSNLLVVDGGVDQLGVGMTPDQSWGSNSVGINFGIADADAGWLGWQVISGGDNFNMLWNVYHDNSDFRYASNNGAGMYTQNNGSHLFYGAATGSADAVITFTENFRTNTTGAVFNEGSADLDFRVESDGNANMLFVDGGNNCVGIGTNTNHGGELNVVTTGGATNLALVCTDTDANPGPILDLRRDAGNVPSDNDAMGVINFQNDNTDLVMHTYASISAFVDDVSAGTEDGVLRFSSIINGTEKNRIDIIPTAIVINEGAADSDFRIEGNNFGNVLFVDSGKDTVGIRTLTPSSTAALSVHGDGAANYGGMVIRLTDSTNTNNGGVAIMGATKADPTVPWTGVGFWDQGSVRQLSYGGGSWGYEEATTHVFYTGSYGAGSGGAVARMTIGNTGHVFIVKTATDLAAVGQELLNDGRIVGTADGDKIIIVNRLSSDGDLVGFNQAGSQEGTISVSGSTVSYNGFSGLHETSGIASNVAIGTVCSTIDELDVYPDTQKDTEGETKEHPKKGQTRADHAKIKVSDTEGDKRVYGVLQRYDDNGKPLVASVGIGSIRVTGACEGGDLLESNGDGTAKVQSDDIIRSKTIGKVTIGNSGTGVKLVSCVLYCG